MDRRYFLALAGGLAAWPSAARAIARPPRLRRLRLANANTGETFEGTYRNDDGPIDRVIEELCVFLRDHHSGAQTQMDVGVIDFLADVLDSVGGLILWFASCSVLAPTAGSSLRIPTVYFVWNPPSHLRIVWTIVKASGLTKFTI